MKKIQKILVYTLIFSVLFQNVYFGYSFADDVPAICHSSSPQFQTYLNFQVEMIGALSHARKEEEKTSGYTTKGLFYYGTLSLPTKLLNVVANSVNINLSNSRDTGRALKVSSIIFLKMVMSAGVDAGQSVVLLKSEPFVRDWKKLQDVDNSLVDLAWDIGMDGLRDEDINPQVLSEILELQKKYYTDSQNSMFETLNMNGNSSYGGAVWKLMTLNNHMKGLMLGKDDSGGLVDYKKVGNSNFKMKFNKKFLNDIWSSYDDASKCTSDWDDFVTNLSELGGIKESALYSRNLIDESTKKLLDSYGNFKIDSVGIVEKSFNSIMDQNLLELLKKVYGIDAMKLTIEQQEGLIPLFKYSANALQSFKLFFSSEFWCGVAGICLDGSNSGNDGEKPNGEKSEENKSDYEKNIDNAKERLGETKDNSGNVIKKIDEDTLLEYVKIYLPDGDVTHFTGLVAELNYGLESVLSDLDSDTNLILNTDSRFSTRYFVEIGYYIHDMVENTIGSKDVNNSLVKDLGETCQYQCYNKGGICYY